MKTLRERINIEEPIWTKERVPPGFWKNPYNRHQYMEWLGKKLGYQHPEDWYKIKQKDFSRNKGGALLKYYKGSPSAAVMEYFPDYAWKEWFFVQVPKRFWNNPENRRRYMQWLSKTLGYKTPEDWYRITVKDFHLNKGKGLLNHYYQDSPSAAVMEYFPDYAWKEWFFGMTPLNFWTKSENRHRYMNWLGEQLGFKTPEDWYKITKRDFYSHRGVGLLSHYYHDSPSEVVKDYLPEHDWKEWLFGTVPRDFWDNFENRRRYMQWLGEKLGFSKLEDWYRITQKDFNRNKGNGCLPYYRGSPSAAVIEYFPDYEWKEWLFNQVPLNFWDNPDNRCQYMQWLGEKLGFSKPEDWYKITAQDFHSHKGGGLLANYYHDSPSAAVIEYLPEYDWKEWLFSNVPRNFWDDLKNRRRYMRWLGETLGYKIPEDWYTVTVEDFYSNNGSILLAYYYKGSPSIAVMDFLPEYEWKEWLFIMTPQGFCSKLSNLRRYMEWLGEILGYKHPEDWYKITAEDFRKHSGRGFIAHCQNSPSVAVIKYLPTYDWQPEKFSFRKKRQKQLYRIVKRIFSGHEVKWDFKHHGMRFESTDRPMELDVFIPSLNIAIEYQGEQHVLPVKSWGGILTLQKIQERDNEKRKACKTQGIILIEVPHSWDGAEDTAIEMLSQQFVKKVKDRVKGTEQIHAALKAINTYCKKKQRKQRKKKSGNHQVNFDFNA